MATQNRLDPDPDHRAAEYRACLAGPPRPDHVAALQALGLPIPRTQREASDLVTAYIRDAGRGLEVGR